MWQPLLLQKSGLLFKHRAAVAAGHMDLALASGGAELLFAVGAGEVAVILVPEDAPTQLTPPDGGAGYLQKGGVFRPPLVVIAGQDAEKAPEQQRGGHIVQNGEVGEGADEIENHIDTQKKKRQLITAVTPVHEALKEIADQTYRLLAGIVSALRTWTGTSDCT